MNVQDILYSSTALQTPTPMLGELEAPLWLEAPDEPVSFMDGFIASAQRENVLLNLWEAGVRTREQGTVEQIDPDWNPHAYMRDNFDGERIERLAPYIADGIFANAPTADALEAQVDHFERELSRVETIERAGGWAAFSGGVAGSLVDPTTFIGFPISGATAAIKAGKAGVAGGLAGLAQEIPLNATQEFRTIEESALNVGGSAFLMGGLGGASHIVGKKLQQMMDMDLQDPQMVRTPAGDTEELVLQGTPESAGAAATESPLSGPVPTLQAAPRFPGSNKVTPIGRLVHRRSAAMRKMGYALVDDGGQALEQHAAGIGSRMSAESLRNDWLLEANTVHEAGEAAINRINAEHSRLDIGTRMLSRQDFYETAMWVGLDDLRPEQVAELAARYGDAQAQRLIGEASQWVEEIHKMNAKFEDELVALGAIREEDRMGREYFMAQMWDRHNVEINPDQFRRVFYEEFQTDPTLDPEWLAGELGIDDSVRVGGFVDEKAVEQAWNSVDDTTRLAVLREWTDEVEVLELDKAMFADKAAQQELKYALDEYAEAARALGEIKKGQTSLNLKQARAKTKAFEAQLQKLQARRAVAKTRKEFRSLDTEYKKIAKRHQALRGKLNVVEAKQELAKVAKRERVAAAQEAKRAKAKAEAKARKAGKKLAGVQSKKRLAAVIEEIRHNLSNRHRVPYGIIDRMHGDDFTPTTGRLRKRQIRLSKLGQKLARAGDRPLLRTDLPVVLDMQYRQLAGHISLRRSLDIGPDGYFKSWGQAKRVVENDYDDLIEEAVNKGDTKLRDSLVAEKADAIADLNILKDRVLGQTDPGVDPDSWAYWLSDKVVKMNYIRHGAGFIISAFTDAAIVGMKTALIPTMWKHAVPAMREALRGLDGSDLARIARSAEMSMNGVRMTSRYSSAADHFVDGVGHGLTRRVSRAIDRGSDMMSQGVTVGSGMRVWNMYWRNLIGIDTSQKLRADVLNWAAAPGPRKERWVSLGVGTKEAKLLKKFFERDPVDAQGRWWFDENNWKDSAEGLEASRIMRIALRREMDRTILVPGAADVPRYASTWWGRMHFQYMSFAMAFMNRVINPAAARIYKHRDLQTMIGLGHLVWTAALLTMIKDLQKGADPMERWEDESKHAELATELLDRSGMFSYLSPYIDAGLKLTAPVQEAALGTALRGGGSRYAQNNALASVVGPAGGLFTDVNRLAGELSRASVGDSTPQDVADRGARFMPFGQWARMMMNLGLDD